MENNFGCLLVSYATLGDDYTSWVDLIPIRDLLEAIKTSTPLTIKCINLSTLKYIKAECTVTETISEQASSYKVNLYFGPTENNRKEEIEEGTLIIKWKVEDEDVRWYKEPCCVVYRTPGCGLAVRPSFAYLDHRDNDSSYFIFVNYKGSTSKKEEIFYVEEFEKNKAKFSDADYDKVYDYVKCEVDKLTEFSVGTRWPNPWPNELMVLHSVLQCVTQAAYFLSGLVQKAILESKYEWLVSKVKLNSRPFPVFYFSRTEKLKGE